MADNTGVLSRVGITTELLCISAAGCFGIAAYLPVESSLVPNMNTQQLLTLFGSLLICWAYVLSWARTPYISPDYER
jgi:hypothetical protein